MAKLGDGAIRRLKQLGLVYVMAGRPSRVSDYISISLVLRTVEKMQNDPARLRSLVYDLARRLQHVSTTYRRLGSARLQQHLDLETAINQVKDLVQKINHVKDLAQKQIGDVSQKRPLQEQREVSADLAFFRARRRGDRVAIPITAPHESGYGPKRTSRQCPRNVAFRCRADIAFNSALNIASTD
jgi:hypothetical protein